MFVIFISWDWIGDLFQLEGLSYVKWQHQTDRPDELVSNFESKRRGGPFQKSVGSFSRSGIRAHCDSNTRITHITSLRAGIRYQDNTKGVCDWTAGDIFLTLLESSAWQKLRDFKEK